MSWKTDKRRYKKGGKYRTAQIRRALVRYRSQDKRELILPLLSDVLRNFGTNFYTYSLRRGSHTVTRDCLVFALQISRVTLLSWEKKGAIPKSKRYSIIFLAAARIAHRVRIKNRLGVMFFRDKLNSLILKRSILVF